MGKIDPNKLLSLNNLFGLDLMIFLLIGLFLMWKVIQKPHMFWPYLILVNILGTGPRFRGYFLFDEMFSGFLVLGALIRLGLSRPIRERSGASVLHMELFLIWLLYMIIESFLGIVMNDDLRIVRWVLFYGLLVCTFYVSSKERLFPFPTFRTSMLWVMLAVFIHFTAYIFQGYIMETELGKHGRFLSQDMLWAGSSYAVFPILVGVPAALVLIKDHAFPIRALSWGLLTLTLFVGFYFDSRAIYLGMLAFLLGYVVRLNFTQILSACGMVLLVFAITSGNPLTIGWLFIETQILDSINILVDPTERDMNRSLQWLAGWNRMTDNPWTFLIGDGVYSHRFTIIPHIEYLYANYLGNQDFLIPGSRDDTSNLKIFRTVGFTALAVDTGFIGIVLFSANFILLGTKILNRPTEKKILWITTLGLGFGWLFISNINDILLLYLLVMPNGILDQWCRASQLPLHQTQHA